MNNINKIKNYWNKRAKSKFYKCTNDLNLQEKEFEILLDIIKPNKSILDIGCGDGMLLKKLAKIRKIRGLGLDYSKELINEANKNKVKNIEFKCLDMRSLKKENNKTYDYIITKRSIQNLTKWSYQKKVIDNLHLFSKKKSKILLIESSSTALENINIVREKLKLKKIVKPWHNLYLDDKKIIKTKFKNIRLLEIKELFSTYYFISRTLNAALAKKKKKVPKYNDILNIIGWRLPQNIIRNFSQLKLYEFKKIK